ncbi:MAG: MGMT family protein [bacterium]|nr:MGMT family protein [bacterium]
MARRDIVYTLNILDYGTFLYKIGDKGLTSLDWQEKRETRENSKDPLGLAKLLTFYFSGEKIDFRDIPIDYGSISPTYIEILEFIRDIPYGTTITYGEVAKKLGRPRSARVVGNAMRINPCPIVIPCHRLVSKNGLGGYSLGIDKKILLLNLEGVKIC